MTLTATRQSVDENLQPLSVTKVQAVALLKISEERFDVLCKDWPEILGHSYVGLKRQRIWRAADIDRASLRLAGYAVDTANDFNTDLEREGGD